MKSRLLTLLLSILLAACGTTRRYEPLPEPTPGPVVPTPTPTPTPVPVPPEPSPEEPRDGALPASLFAPFVEGTTTYNEVIAIVGVGIEPAGNPDQSGTWWFVWPKVDCGPNVLFGVLGFKPRPGSTARPENFVLFDKKICR